MLKMAGIELELILCIDLYLFVEKEMRGSISYIAKRYSKVNNKYMQFYDDKKLSKYITYRSSCKQLIRLGIESIFALWWI